MRAIGIVIGLALSLIVPTGAAVHGQEAEATGSPAPAAPGALELAPGVTAEALAFIPGEEVPAVYRLRLDAGSTYDFTGDASLALAVVEAGDITLTADAPLTIHRGEAAGSAGEQLASAEAVDLTAGDHLIVPALASGQLRNDGAEPASMLVASLRGPDSAAGPSPTSSPGGDG